MKRCEHVLFERKPAVYFTEAYPIGNGKLGGMVYGDPMHMRLGLNHDELWAGYQPKADKMMDSSIFKEVKRLTVEGKYMEAQRLYEKEISIYDGGGYLTLGDLFIDFPDGEITDYIRTLDVRESIATVSFKLAGIPVTVEYIASNPRGAILVNIKSAEKISYTVTADFEMIQAVTVKGTRVTAFGECDSACERFKRRAKKYPDFEERSGIRFASAFDICTDGEVELDGEAYSVTATESTLALSCETTYKDGKEYGKDNYKSLLQGYIDAALSEPYDTVRSEHIKDVTALFDRVSFTLEGVDASDVPTSERIKNFANGVKDNSLIVLQFNIGRYFLIAASREGSRPTNLQGIWNEHMDAPWCSNYTTNINTEMNYWPALPCAMPELLEPLESQIRILAKTGRAIAKEFYDVEGICASHNSDIFGQAFPAHGWMCWSYFPLSFGWLLRELYNKYEYTLDKDYLESIYEFIYGNAEFILNSLYDDGDYLIMTPGTSAENHYIINGEECAVARSSTFFASIAREGIEHFIEASEILEKESELLQRARQALPRMLPLRITDDGRIEEWYFGGESKAPVEAEPTHRHISHLYDLHPACGINPDTPELFAAAKRSLLVRGDEATGWSLGWKINCYARLHDGEGVMRLIRMFLRPVSADTGHHASGGGVYPNLMCAHPPFQIDGNFGYASAICEMLFAQLGDKIIPAPAIPKELATGEMRGVMLRKNRRADIAWKNGEVTEFKVY